MDFAQRTPQHANSNLQTATDPSGGLPKRKRVYDVSSKSWRIITTTMLVAVAILVLAIALLLHFNDKGEFAYVNNKVLQAVDINVAGGTSDQIYFGSIKAINSGYMILENVYYFPSTSSSSSSAQNLSLQPLVCQIDAPYNRIVVSRASVNWWENLQANGKVSQAIASYQKNNPNGPNCSTSNNSTSTTNNSTSNNSTSSNGTSNTSSTGSNSSTSTNGSSNANNSTSSNPTGSNSSTSNSTTGSSTPKTSGSSTTK